MADEKFGSESQVTFVNSTQAVQRLPLCAFPHAKSIKGIGLTDPDCIARVLAERFDYQNTYLDAEPRLDIR